jgi:hypothetical protein
MQNIIAGIGLLQDLPEADIDMMEQAALLHRRHSKLSFKILEAGEKIIKIRVTQEKSPAGNHFPAKRLIEIVHETFDRFFPGKKIHVHPVPYVESPVVQVDAAWINKKMLSTETTLKEIAKDTGLNYTYLSHQINGTKEISQAMRAMFYYYFLAKEIGKLNG